MLPQLGVGGWMPRPRKSRAASIRMIWPTPRLAATISTGSTFGSRWRTINRASRAPIDLVARMKSRCLTDSTSPRTRRATLPHPTEATIAASVNAFGRNRMDIKMKRKIAGIASTVSTSRINTSSVQPP